MYKIKFKYPKIQSKVYPAINSAIDQLNKSISKLDGVRIPSSFKYISEVSELSNFLNSKSENLNKLKDWLIDTNFQYNEIINSMENIINNIESIKIKKRNIIIKNY